MIENFLKQVFKGWVDNINSVHSIFTNYYGEERVDLQMSCNEESWVTATLGWNLDCVSFLEESRLIALNPLFAKMIHAMTNTSVRSICIGKPEELIAANITEEECISMLQSILDSEYDDYLTGFASGRPSNIKLTVWFPEITVTNENNKFEVIYDVYIRILLNTDGSMKGNFTLCRSTFTHGQYRSGYMFSHTRSISNDDVPNFQDCCLGSGPIRYTMSNLMGTYDEDIWLLFCIELDAYLRVESLNGGPYIKLETIGNNRSRKTLEQEFPNSIKTVISAGVIHRPNPSPTAKAIYKLINGFISYIIKERVLRFNYINGAYNIAHSYVDVRVTLSNAFIAYVNTLNLADYLSVRELYEKRIIVSGVVKGNGIEVSSINENTIDDATPRHMPFSFKGNRVPFVIKREEVVHSNDSIFLANNVTLNILNHLLTYLNYGRNKDNTPITGSYYQ